MFIKVTTSTLLEDEATDTDRANGLNIADFIIAEVKSKNTFPELQSYFCSGLRSMIERNKALLVMINELNSQEV